ncbi:MAG: HAD family hydrolase [Lachnospiraceae bacterium]|nr:HAD family hydrolase [Lachnospiraceae bacterium]
MKKNNNHEMRVSFDLDEVLFVSPQTHKTEPELIFPFNKIFIERLRLGAPALIRALRDLGYEVWVYTSSFRSERYIRTLFLLYGVRFDGIINGTRHLNEVQKGHSETLPQKVPSHYGISLHVDDESVICTYGREFGFEAFQLEAPDDEWKEKILERAFQVKRKLKKQ